MIQACIITESQSDMDIIKKILSDELLESTKLYAGLGQYDAHSMATTILLADRIPVVLIVDTRADDKDIVVEKFNDINFLMRQSSPGVPYKIVMAVPEIEVVLLQNRDLIEKIIGQHFTDLEWEFACCHPKRFLSRFLGDKSQYIQTIFENMNAVELSQLQQHPIMAEITNFLSNVFATYTKA
ncbi:hypothetical protein NIES4071_22280 [Calothrix sp. NIES-4071]|nr:hypothetical protein NIES4071_22280 [Calothrix sp. NIES-4071]BAZ56560.1 hypothetical protein NIES4105_22230 [Calothrix sp. NIES-4105]